MPRFFVLDGQDLGRSFELAEGDVLGRDSGCAATLRDASVSRRHARLEREGEGWVLVDLDSRNGVRRGGERLGRVPLEDDVEIVLGRLPLRVRLDGAPGVAGPSPPAPAAEPPVAPAPRGSLELEEEIELAPPPRIEPAEEGARERSPAAPRELDERERARLEILRPPVQRTGLLSSDLSQLPATTRWALYLLVLAVCAGLAYGVFLLATYLRSR